MFTVILIGNPQSYVADGKFITPRGYYLPPNLGGIGQQIMMESFRTIASELKQKTPHASKGRLPMKSATMAGMTPRTCPQT